MKIRITKKGLPKAQRMGQVSLQGRPMLENYSKDQAGYEQWAADMDQWQKVNGFTPVGPGFATGVSNPTYINLTNPSQQQSNWNWMSTNQQPVPVNPNQPKMYPVNNEGTPVLSKKGSDISGDRKTDEAKGMSMLTNWYNPKGDVSRKDMRGYLGAFNENYGTDLKLPGVGPKLAKTARDISTGIDSLKVLGNVVDYFDANKKAKDWERYFRQKQMEQAPSTEFEGIENINTGRMFENMLPKPNQGRLQYGGENTEPIMKIRITSSPEKMKYGGQSNYGLDLGRNKVYADMPESYSDSVSSTIKEVPRFAANIEAERGETVYGDMDGDGAMEHMKIGGDRHYKGGTPLNVPEGSFIFSDTKKMTIKDPAILAMFGKTVTSGKKGYTPAQLARQYDVNKYKAIMEDPEADPISKSTAQLMATNYRKKLAALSLVQESMKGFPQGIPQVAAGMVGPEMTAAYGGYYLPKAQKGKQKTADDVIFTPEFQKILSDLKTNKNVNMVYSPRILAGDNRVPLLQPKQSSGLYGDVQTSELDEFKKRHEWYFKNKPNWDPTNEDDVLDFQTKYDDEFAKTQGYSYFTGQRKFDKKDKKFGEYTYNAPALYTEKPKDTTVSGFICLGVKDNGYPDVQRSSYKDEQTRTAAGAYASEQEAIMHCKRKETPGEEIPPGKKRPPGDFLTPDKLTLAAAAAMPPKGYFPSVSDVQFRPGQLALEDWLSQAQNIQQSYNTAANTLANFQPGTALASNLSFLAGQAGDQAARAISEVGSRNVDRFNQFANTETQRKQNIDLYNAAARDKRWDGYTITKQNLDNARRRYLNTVTKAANNMWANRMYLDMINAVNPFFNVDPKSGLSYYMSGYSPQDLARFSSSGSTAGSASGSWDNLASRKAFYMSKGMSETNAEKKAIQEIEGPRSTYVDTNNDGVPNRVSTTGAGPLNYMSQFLPMYFAMKNLSGNAYPPQDYNY